MSMKVIERGDTLVTQLSPIRDVPFYGDWLRALLVRGAAREVRRKIVVIDDLGNKSSTFRTAIEPFTSDQEQAAIVDGDRVGIICLGCGQPIYGEVHDSYQQVGKSRIVRSKLTDPIRIGGLIQMAYEEPTAPKRITIKWRVQPVYKTGIGCKGCKARYAESVAAANQINIPMKLYADFMLAAAHKIEAPIDAAHIEAMKEGLKVKCSRHGLPKMLCAACNRGMNILPKAPRKVEAAKELTPFIDVFQSDVFQVAEP